MTGVLQGRSRTDRERAGRPLYSGQQCGALAQILEVLDVFLERFGGRASRQQEPARRNQTPWYYRLGRPGSGAKAP